MPDILIVADAPTVLAEVRSALEDEDTDIRELRVGAQVRGAVEDDPPDLLITDLQVGSMGGVAICHDLRLEESGERQIHVPVLILLDRRADVFIAKECDAEGWLVKPLDPLRLRKAAAALLDGGTYFDESYKPVTLANQG
ncbi:MAG: response regulator [Acidimicrobiales bacterium]